MSVTVNGSTGLTFNDGTSQSTSAFYGGLALRNRIINGAMMIDQRNAGASQSISADTGFWATDRFRVGAQGGGVFSVQQSSTAPTGFSNSLLFTVTTADSSLASGDLYYTRQWIEGFNTADLMWGTANAAAVTLSFWVRSSVTGTFAGSFTNSDYSRAYPFTYVINSANTWEQKTVTLTGDTTGTWIGATNGRGIGINFNIGSGSGNLATANTWASGAYFGATGQTNLIATNGATFYITGVQLEKGSTATSFDYRPYGTELALCQRYFEKTYDIGTAVGTNLGTSVGAFQNNGTTESGGNAYFNLPYKISKRAQPTITFYTDTGTSGSGNFSNSGGASTKTAGTSSVGFNSAICYLLAGASAWTNCQVTVQATISAEL